MARPTKYNERFVDEAGILCEELGADDKALARFFKVSRSTINLWKHDHPEFSDSIKKGKDFYDSHVVERSLLKRALGYSVKERVRERQIKPGQASTDEEPLEFEMVLTKEVTKHIPGEVTACIFWLKNRRPDRWRDKSEVGLTSLEELLAFMSKERKPRGA